MNKDMFFKEDEIVVQLDPSDRGNNGFDSTGR